MITNELKENLLKTLANFNQDEEKSKVLESPSFVSTFNTPFVSILSANNITFTKLLALEGISPNNIIAVFNGTILGIEHCFIMVLDENFKLVYLFKKFYTGGLLDYMPVMLSAKISDKGGVAGFIKVNNKTHFVSFSAFLPQTKILTGTELDNELYYMVNFDIETEIYDSSTVPKLLKGNKYFKDIGDESKVKYGMNIDFYESKKLSIVLHSVTDKNMWFIQFGLDVALTDINRVNFYYDDKIKISDDTNIFGVDFQNIKYVDIKTGDKNIDGSVVKGSIFISSQKDQLGSVEIPFDFVLPGIGNRVVDVFSKPSDRLVGVIHDVITSNPTWIKWEPTIILGQEQLKNFINSIKSIENTNPTNSEYSFTLNITPYDLSIPTTPSGYFNYGWQGDVYNGLISINNSDGSDYNFKITSNVIKNIISLNKLDKMVVVARKEITLNKLGSFESLKFFQRISLYVADIDDIYTAFPNSLSQARLTEYPDQTKLNYFNDMTIFRTPITNKSVVYLAGFVVGGYSPIGDHYYSNSGTNANKWWSFYNGNFDDPNFYKQQFKATIKIELTIKGSSVQQQLQSNITSQVLIKKVDTSLQYETKTVESNSYDGRKPVFITPTKFYAPLKKRSDDNGNNDDNFKVYLFNGEQNTSTTESKSKYIYDISTAIYPDINDESKYRTQLFKPIKDLTKIKVWIDNVELTSSQINTRCKLWIFESKDYLLITGIVIGTQIKVEYQTFMNSPIVTTNTNFIAKDMEIKGISDFNELQRTTTSIIGIANTNEDKPIAFNLYRSEANKDLDSVSFNQYDSVTPIKNLIGLRQNNLVGIFGFTSDYLQTLFWKQEYPNSLEPYQYLPYSKEGESTVIKNFQFGQDFDKQKLVYSREILDLSSKNPIFATSVIKASDLNTNNYTTFNVKGATNKPLFSIPHRVNKTSNTEVQINFELRVGQIDLLQGKQTENSIIADNMADLFKTPNSPLIPSFKLSKFEILYNNGDVKTIDAELNRFISYDETNHKLWFRVTLINKDAHLSLDNDPDELRLYSGDNILTRVDLTPYANNNVINLEFDILIEDNKNGILESEYFSWDETDWDEKPWEEI